MAAKLTAVPTEALITGDELLSMGDIGPCELIEGRIVHMRPTGHAHGRYEIRFGAALEAYANQSGRGRVMVGEVGIYTHRGPDTVRAADVIFIANETFARQGGRAGFLEVPPERVVEILSPDDRWQDVTQKMREYFAAGVKLVWIAEPGAKTVHAYRSLTDVHEFGVKDVLTGDEDVLPGFSASVAALVEE